MYGYTKEEFLSLFTIRSWYDSHKHDHLLEPQDLEAMENGKVSVQEVELELKARGLA